MEADFIFSIIILAPILLIFRQSIRRTEWPGFYRIFLIVAFSCWASLLWIRTYRPSERLWVISILIFVIFISAAFIPYKAPRNRRETKALLENVEKQRTLESFFDSRGKWIFWTVFGFLIWAVVYRLLRI